MKYSLATRKFAACAWIAGLSSAAMAIVGIPVVIYGLGLFSMSLILTVLLFGKDSKRYWVEV